MSAFKGTPGPWEAVPTVAPKGWHIEARDRTYTVAIARDGTGDAQNVANARMIAAAPCMLEALKYARDGMEASGGWDGDEQIFDLVVSAIKKATGEQP